MSIHEIRVAPIEGDPVGMEVAAEIERTMELQVAVEASKVYRFEGITDQEAIRLRSALVDPITEVALGNSTVANNPFSVEVAYKPGVMNPEAASLMKTAHDMGIQAEAADS